MRGDSFIMWVGPIVSKSSLSIENDRLGSVPMEFLLR